MTACRSCSPDGGSSQSTGPHWFCRTTEEPPRVQPPPRVEGPASSTQQRDLPGPGGYYRQGGFVGFASVFIM